MKHTNALRQLTVITVLVTLLLPACTFAQQNSSASFRGGISRNGSYKGEDFNAINSVKWRFKTEGAVRSTPTYHNGNLFVGSSDGALYCLDANAGTKRWLFQASAAVHSTAAVAGNKILFTDKLNRLYALQSENGKKIWQTNLNHDLNYEWGFDYYQSSPVVVNNTVYVGSGDGHMYAVNVADGKVKWKYKAASLVRSSPTIHNKLVYFGDLAGYVYALNAETGLVQWNFATRGDTVVNEKYGNDYKAVIASVAVADGVAVVGGRDGYLYALDATTGKERWNFNYDGSWVVTSVAIQNGIVVTGTSDQRYVQAFDLQTGKTIWKYKTPGTVWASPIIVNTTVLAAVNDGFLYGLDFHTGAEKFRYLLGERSLSSPVYHNGTVYIGNDDGNISALLTEQKPPPAKPVAKAVFYTSDVYGKYFKAGLNSIVKDYFSTAGYQVLNESQLREFLLLNSNDSVSSVVVFATGYFPPQIITGDKQSILYNYLSSGGKIVVLGINPALHDFNDEKQEYLGLNYSKCERIIGVSYPHNDLRSHGGFYDARPTEEGKQWGLTQTITSYAAVNADQVTALALNENGRAAYWVKNYGHKQGTGFVQLWITATTLHHLEQVKHIAEYGLD